MLERRRIHGERRWFAGSLLQSSLLGRMDERDAADTWKKRWKRRAREFIVGARGNSRPKTPTPHWYAFPKGSSGLCGARLHVQKTCLLGRRVLGAVSRTPRALGIRLGDGSCAWFSATSTGLYARGLGDVFGLVVTTGERYHFHSNSPCLLTQG